ncbi:hypothetical protein KAJ38_01315 [Candidatus Pacearchaeota archaeon]|nr:hypothetical protein [Candidatus Pacearchaeota archaeon]
MDNIQLENRRAIEIHQGRNVDKAPALLTRWEKGEGYIPSEADIRLLGVRNFGNAPQIIDNVWYTSTLSATKGKDVKVILPYETGSKTLTEVARFGLDLFNPGEVLVNFRVKLDVDDRWEKLEGSGVYILRRNGLILDRSLTESEAMNHKLLLTKLGHPDYVDNKFARSKDEVAEIIGRTFELGKSVYGYKNMMGQYLPEVSDKGVLNFGLLNRLGGGADSDRAAGVAYDFFRVAFESFGNVKSDAEGLEEKVNI